MRSGIILSLAFLSVFLVAGCVKQGQQNLIGYPGVTITAFNPIAPELQAGSSVNLYVSVQNQGYFNAKDANIQIYNCGPIKTGTASAHTGTYDCNEPIFNDPNIPVNAKPFTLDKPDQTIGVAGELKESQITLQTAGVSFPQGRTSHTFSARVSYYYNVTAARDVVFTTFANWQEKSGRIETGPLNAFSIPAPMSLEINAPSTPIITSTETPNPELTVALSLRNVGGGFVRDKTLSKVKLCYDPTFVAPVPDDPAQPNGPFRDFESKDNSGRCLQITTPTNLQLFGQDQQWRDYDAKFTVTGSSVQVQEVVGFDAYAEYTYMTDRSTSVTVLN